MTLTDIYEHLWKGKKCKIMVQKIIYKTKDYCKVKFTFGTDNAERIEIFGLNNNWQMPLKMKKEKMESLLQKLIFLKALHTNLNIW